MKPPVETWRCPTCGTRVGLYLHAHGRPTCAHVGTPHSAHRETLMVLVEEEEEEEGA